MHPYVSHEIARDRQSRLLAEATAHRRVGRLPRPSARRRVAHVLAALAARLDPSAPPLRPQPSTEGIVASGCS